MNIPVWCISVLNSFQYLISFCMNKGIWNSTYQVPIPRDMVWSISQWHTIDCIQKEKIGSQNRFMEERRQWHTIEFNQKSTNMISKRIHGRKKKNWRKRVLNSLTNQEIDVGDGPFMKLYEPDTSSIMKIAIDLFWYHLWREWLN